MKITATTILETTTSTNTYVKTHLDTMVPGTLVRAIAQTDGKGRRGTTWHAKPGKNLTFSFLLEGDIAASRRVLMASVLAVVDALDGIGVCASVKLPNDVYIDHHKVAGILLETTVQRGKAFIVCGVGINVNELAPDRYDPIASSLAVKTKKTHALGVLLQAFTRAFNDQINETTLFQAFKTITLRRQHVVMHHQNHYRLIDFTPDFTCQIETNGDTKHVPCERLTFTLK